MKTIPVMEIFGPTIQGEGALIGKQTMFVRTAGCDYQCVWCDSSFTWDGTEKDSIRQMTVDEIWEELYKKGGKNFSHVTLSGGNPALLLQLGELTHLLRKKKIKIAVETQGSKWQDWLLDIDDITLSPKPPSAAIQFSIETFDEIVERLKNHPNISIKIVIFTEDDLEFAKKIHQMYPNIPFYLQPGNENVILQDKRKYLQYAINRYETLVEQVIQRKELNQVKVLPQLHTFIWGNQREV